MLSFAPLAHPFRNFTQRRLKQCLDQETNLYSSDSPTIIVAIQSLTKMVAGKTASPRRANGKGAINARTVKSMPTPQSPSISASINEFQVDFAKAPFATTLPGTMSKQLLGGGTRREGTGKRLPSQCASWSPIEENKEWKICKFLQQIPSPTAFWS